VTVSKQRVGAVYRKELREYRRNRSLVIGMSVLPLLFSINPLITVFALPASSSSGLRHEDVLLYLLGIPAIVPTVMAAYAIAGERAQGTLEPVLTTPIRRDELILGKALAVAAPSLVIAYAVYAAVLVCVAFFARPGVASALLRAPDLLAQVLFTPLLIGWSIWVGMAVSTRVTEVRVAQQLGLLASLPSVAVTTLIALGVIPATPGVAFACAALLLLLNRLGWRLVSAMFDRERLVTGARA
jgi:ABC-type transport system involved in multi-copper enzyme maturation permease subunit